MVVRQILKTVESTKETRDFHYRRRRLRKILKILLSPKLGPAVRPLQDSGRRLIHLIANVFAIYRLLPKNYPGLGNMEEPMSLKKVFADAWKNVKFTKEGLPQAILFFAIIGAIVFSVFALFVTVLGIFSSTAMAAPAYNQGTFDPAANDIADKWLRYVFLTGDLQQAYMSGEPSGIPQAKAYHEAFVAMLAYYSYAILIVAAIILFYILTAMLVETAHEGVPMGKNANQIWAPIRLVVAVGLLVPINGGLNSGQYIVVKMAQWGSGLGSQVWNIFFEKMANYPFEPLPTGMPIVSKIAYDTIQMYACQHAYNTRAPYTLGSTLIAEVGIPGQSVKGHNGTKVAFSTVELFGKDACGWYFIPDIPDHASEEAKKAYMIERQAFIAQLPEFKRIGVEKMTKVMSSNVGGGGATPDEFDNQMHNAIINYQKALNEAMMKLTNESQGQLKVFYDLSKDLGWVMAGTFLPAIERFQTHIDNAVTAGMPLTQPPAYVPDRMSAMKDAALSPLGILGMIASPIKGVGDYISGIFEADTSAKVAEDLASFQMYTAAELSQKKADDIACSAMVGLQDAANQNAWDPLSDAIDWVLMQVDNAAKYFGVWTNSSEPTPCGVNTPDSNTAGLGLNTFRLGIELSGPDIIQQMMRMGHGSIDTALKLLAIGVLAQAMGGIGGALIGGVSGLAAGGVGAVPGAIAGSLAGSAGMIIGTICMFLALVFFVAGFTLAFVLPMYVFARFFFAVVSWFGGVVEGVVAVPLIALAHLNPEGHGLPGGKARHAYFFVFNIFLRPVLIIFGTILGLIVFMVTAHFLVFAYGIAVASSGGTAAAHEVITKIFYTVLYVAMVYISANNSFALIDHLPDKALQWMGEHGQVMPQLGNAQELAQYEAGVAAVAGQQTIGKIGEVSTAGTNAAKGAIDAGFGKQEKVQAGIDAKNNQEELINAIKAGPQGGGGGGGSSGGGAGASSSDGGAASFEGATRYSQPMGNAGLNAIEEEPPKPDPNNPSQQSPSGKKT